MPCSFSTNPSAQPMQRLSLLMIEQDIFRARQNRILSSEQGIAVVSLNKLSTLINLLQIKFKRTNFCSL